MSARSKTPTKRGGATAPPPNTDEIPTEILDGGKRAKAKPQKPKAAAAPMPIKAISMKTPGAIAKREMPEAEMPHVKLRAMSEVSRANTPQNLGNLAPPYDPDEARKRTAREYVIWACIAVMLASVIALVMWFVAR